MTTESECMRWQSPSLPRDRTGPPRLQAGTGVNKLFRMVMKHEASDLHLKVGQPPMMRLKGDIRRMDTPPLTEEQMERLLLPIMTPKQRTAISTTKAAWTSPRSSATTNAASASASSSSAAGLGWLPAA